MDSPYTFQGKCLPAWRIRYIVSHTILPFAHAACVRLGKVEEKNSSIDRVDELKLFNSIIPCKTLRGDTGLQS